MRDFCDGDLFSPGGHPLFSTNPKALQILLYYDDFEIANPLGAKATIHKIGKITLSLLVLLFDTSSLGEW